MRVIWIDPGETVGWATAEVHLAGSNPDDLYCPPPRLEVLDYGNTKLKRFALALLDGAHKYDVIGYEEYLIRADAFHAHAGKDCPTLQLVGMIRLAAWHAQRRPQHSGTPVGTGPKLVTQDPGKKSKGRGAAKLHLSTDIQEAIAEGLEGPHDDGHYADALLHLAAWFHALS